MSPTNRDPGLVGHHPPPSTLPDDTAADYMGELTLLGEAITAYRRAESGGGGHDDDQPQQPARAVRVRAPAQRRVARAVLAAGPIVCGCCGTEFTVDDPRPRKRRPRQHRPGRRGG